MKSLEPKVIFSINDNVNLLMKAAELENVTSKFVVFDENKNILSLDNILSSATEHEVKNFKPQYIQNPKTTPAIIISTSGSTGVQKEVVHSYESIAANFFTLNLESSHEKKIDNTLG